MLFQKRLLKVKNLENKENAFRKKLIHDKLNISTGCWLNTSSQSDLPL